MSVRDDIRAKKYEPDPVKFPFNTPGASEGERKAERVKHRTEELRLRLLFKADAIAELGIGHVPRAKLDKAWEMAWDRGHATGLEDVLYEFEELAELLA